MQILHRLADECSRHERAAREVRMAKTKAGIEHRHLDAGAAEIARRHLAADQAPGGAQHRGVQIVLLLTGAGLNSEVFRDRFSRPDEATQVVAVFSKHEILGLDGLHGPFGGELNLGAQPAFLHRPATDTRDSDLWEHQGLGIAERLECHSLAFEVPRVRDA